MRHLLDRERTARTALAEREAELARLNAQLVEDSRRDPLTGMRNRRALADDLLELEARRGLEGGFAVALCDVDHFKAYNDRLGHLAGDHALRTISAIVRATLRTGDLSYRFGGEELLLILRNADAEEAHAVAERVRVAVQAAGVPHPDGVDGVLTVSVGVAAGADDTDRLLARADGALYDAKRQGRNRTVLAAEVASDAGLAAAGLRQHEPAEGPVPRHLRSMLAVSRAAASGHGPLPVLEALAEAIRSELSFHVVAINLLDRDSGEMRIVTVLGDDDAHRTLMGTSSAWSEWEPIMGPEFERQGAIWLPAGASDWGDQIASWTPSMSAVPGPDGWHPEDMLMLPLRGQDGEVLGAVSVDQPASGRRPTDEQIAYLMSVVDHAAIGVEQSLREAGPTAEEAGQSSELRLAAAMLLAEALDLRDPSTGRHSRTVGAYARQIALRLELAPERVERVHAAGVLHDLGKLGIADAILYKPGALTDSEWEEMKRHPEIGARILLHAGLADIAHWVRAHHERIDGRGYPDRLSAEEIPLEARILAVADAYEAMIADRPYRVGHGARGRARRARALQRQPVRPGRGRGLPRGARCRACRRRGLGRGLGLDPAAVDHPRLTADRRRGRRGELHDRVGHLLGLEQAAQRRGRGQGGLGLLGRAAGARHDVGDRPLGHLGAHEGGADGVDAHPGAGELGGHGAGEADHRVLGGGVGGRVGDAGAPGGRGDGDDRTRPALAHAGDDRAHAQKRPGGVDVEVALPGLERRLVQRRGLAHPGAVDEHVHVADARKVVGHGALVGDIAAVGVDAGQGAQRRVVAPEGDDPVAVLRKAQHGRPADAARAAGHHHRPAHSSAARNIDRAMISRWISDAPS